AAGLCAVPRGGRRDRFVTGPTPHIFEGTRTGAPRAWPERSRPQILRPTQGFQCPPSARYRCRPRELSVVFAVEEGARGPERSGRIGKKPAAGATAGNAFHVYALIRRNRSGFPDTPLGTGRSG